MNTPFKFSGVEDLFVQLWAPKNFCSVIIVANAILEVGISLDILFYYKWYCLALNLLATYTTAIFTSTVSLF